MRVGTPAVTTRGLVESDMVQLVEWMDAVLQAPEDAAVIQRVGDAVREKFTAYPLPDENGHHPSRVRLTGSMSIVSKLRPLWRQVVTACDACLFNRHDKRKTKL